MNKTYRKLAILITLFMFIGTGVSNADSEDDKYYRYEMASQACSVIEVRGDFSRVLKSLDFEDIFADSESVGNELNQMRNHLAQIEVPEKYQKPHELFVESLTAYQRSLAHIHKAMGIALGYSEGTEAEASQHMERGDYYTGRANFYFNRSLELYQSAINEKGREFPGEVLVRSGVEQESPFSVSFSRAVEYYWQGSG